MLQGMIWTLFAGYGVLFASVYLVAVFDNEFPVKGPVERKVVTVRIVLDIEGRKILRLIDKLEEADCEKMNYVITPARGDPEADFEEEEEA